MEKKVVFITGCSSGIGKALALEFHKQNFQVIATARNLKKISDLKKVGIKTYKLDITNSSEIDQVIDSILQEEKKVDILINNAGYGLMGPMIEIPDEELKKQFQTNVFSLLTITKKIAPSMRSRGEGQIYNIGSISGLVTTPFSGAYCASKAAVHAISDALRMELSPFGINVITVQAGGIKSDFGKNADKKAAEILQKDSWYHAAENEIKMRASISQKGASPVEKFAKKIVSIAKRRKQPKIIRFGNLSIKLPLMKILIPIGILEHNFKKKFGLLKVK